MSQARINNKTLEIFVDDKEKAREIMDSLSAFEPGYEHNTLYRMGKWDGKRKFYKIQVIQGGWFFKTEIGFKNRIEDLLEIEVADEAHDIQTPLKFLKEKIIPDLPFTPYKHQMKLFVNAAESKTHLGVSSVGSGKSLVVYMLLRYFRAKGLKCLVLVPTIDLTAQLSGDCKDYNATEKFMNDIQLIGGEFTNKEIHKPVVFSTWQSAQKSDIDGFDVCINDECLHPETLIETSQGLVEIQHLNKGDLVYTLNEDTKEKELKPIVKVHKNISNEQMFEIKTSKGTLRITGNHKVLTQRGWVRADELTLDDDIKET